MSQIPFSASDIDFQSRYVLRNLKNGELPGDSVAMRQLTPIVTDVQNLVNQMANVVMDNDFAGLFNAAANSADLRNSAQVDAAIAAALAGLPEPEARLISVAVATVFQGSLADAATAQFPDVTPSDSLDIDDAATTCVLIDSPNAGETGLYQLRTNGVLSSLNSALFAQQLGFYSRFYVIASGSRPGREFAIVALDANAATLEIEEIPYSDEYVGLGPISISNQNKTVNLRFSANDFVLASSGSNEFSLHPALKAAINLIPGLQQQFTVLEGDVEALSETLTEQIALLTGQIQQLQSNQQVQAQNLSTLQSSMGDLLARLATLEATAARKADFLRGFNLIFRNGTPDAQMLQGEAYVPVPVGLVQVLGIVGDFAVVKINHNFGQYIHPIYWEANVNGQPVRQSTLTKIVGMELNATTIEVETYKNVFLEVPSAIANTVFA